MGKSSMYISQVIMMRDHIMDSSKSYFIKELSFQKGIKTKSYDEGANGFLTCFPLESEYFLLTLQIYK